MWVQQRVQVRMRILTIVFAWLTVAACNAQPSSAPPSKPATIMPTAFEPGAYESALTAFAARQATLAKQFKDANSKDKAAVRILARSAILAFIDDTVFPSWQGTPWGLGKNSTATRPHQPEMVVGCSYFVTSVLQNAGLKLSNRYKFAQAPALFIQRSLAPQKRDLHIFYSIPADQLERRLAAVGDGLYVIGLNNHVGFVRVKAGAVRFVHASYTGDQVVTDEALVDAEAIHNSRKAGYFVTPVFADDRLIDHWLTGKAVPFQELGRNG